MKKKIIYVLALLILVGGTTGCFNKKEEKKVTSSKEFTMTCTTEKDNSTGIEVQTVVTYNFNSDQYATGYTTVTTQKFNSADVYNEYKKEQEETTKDTSEENITYGLKADDKNMTLEFTMTLKNIDKSATTKEEKDKLKASTLLKSNEEKKATCELNGITKDELK